VAWLFWAVGPTQPHQAVHAKAGMAVQAPVSVEIAAVADACPVAPFQLTPRSDHERDRARTDANGRRVWRWLVGRSETGPQGPIRCCSGIDVSSEDLGDEDHQRTADREQQLIEAFCQQRGGGQRGGGRLGDHGQEHTAKDNAGQQADPQVPKGASPGSPANPLQRQAQAAVFGGHGRPGSAAGSRGVIPSEAPSTDAGESADLCHPARAPG
jgi:hypothetical protein